MWCRRDVVGAIDADPVGNETVLTTSRSDPDGEGRTARKRRAIIEAATTVFLEHSYLGASMDAVAALAAVSKRTVYKQYVDKDTLFTEVVLGATAGVVDSLATAAATLEDTDDVEASLATRFPELGRTWFEQGFVRSLAALGDSLQRLADRGLLRELADPELAARQFAGLVMYVPVNQAMFLSSHESVDPSDFADAADSAVRVFLAAYGRLPA